jgi:DNA-binding MarR family transcriptional regulator
MLGATSEQSRQIGRVRTLTKRDYVLLSQFRHLLRGFSRFSETAARVAGLTPQQHQALLAIRGFPGREYLTVSELAERLNAYHNSAVGLVDRLVAKRLVRRRRDLRDGRRVTVALTSKGRAALAALTLSHQEELRELGPMLKRLLTQIVQASAER